MAGRISMTCPACAAPFEGEVSPGGGDLTCPSCGAVAGRVDLPDAAAYDETPGFPRPFGVHDLLAELGRGSGGVVYRARHRELGRIAALKRMPADDEAGSPAAERRAREARLAARVVHPHLVPVLESGRLGPWRWFTMPLCEGGSLRDRLARSGPLPPREAAEVLGKVARGLHALHLEGLVHRDVKPANILFDARGEPALGDFGLARDLHTPRAVTRTGDWIGTPAYMAPELIAGRGREAGPAADVYALGAVFYETIVGRPPFAGETLIELTDAILTGRFASPTSVRPGLHPAVNDVCRRSMSGIPHARHPSALAFAEDLSSLGSGGRFEAGEAGPAGGGNAGPARAGAESSWPGTKSRRRGAAVAVIAVALILLAAGVAFVRGTSDGSSGKGPELRLESAPPAARAFLLRGKGRAEDLGVTPVTVWPAATKGITLRFEASGRLPAVVPLWVDSAASSRLTVRLLAPGELPEGMAYVPAGPFRSQAPGAGPVVRDLPGFLIDVDEVTNAAYARFLAVTGHKPPPHWRGGIPEGADAQPVINVSADDAGAYARWAGRRLPTEAEWEKAARGGDGRRFPWGDAPEKNRLRSGELAFDGPADAGGRPDGASPYGVRDLAGNLREWTATPHPADPTRRIVKGGGWRSPLAECDAGWRDYAPAAGRERDLGFRCVKDLP